jgi:hypothetical protein
VTLWNTITEHPFTIEGHACAVRVDPSNGMNYQFDLIVDGRSQKSGSEVAALPLAAEGGSRQAQWMLAGSWWALPLAIVAVIIGQVGYRARGDFILYVAGFLGMGICFTLARQYVDRPLQGVLRCLVVIAVLIALTLLRVA